MHLPSHRFGPSFNGKLAGMVVRVARESAYPGERRDVEDDAALMVLGLAHDFDGARCHSGRPEEEGLNLEVRFFLRHGLGVARERVAGIVDDHI